VIQVITGATRNISESFRKYLNNISGKRNVKELEKITILATAYILLKVLM
jgi:hypothetical protein